MINFWEQLKKPILALAPMEDVTDTAFREIILSVSQPGLLNIVFTEFTSTDGLCHELGRLNVMERLVVSETEKYLLKLGNVKIVAQIWGSEPENFVKSAKQITDLKLFDGIDINMGCPVKKVVKNKSCSALINYPNLAKEIVQATIEGTNLPVSVKTRIGFNRITTENWIGNLLETNIKALTIHGRTQKMMSEGNAMWDEIGKAVQLRNKMNSNVIILGNGDVSSYADALNRINFSNTDGAMIGTGIFKNPWLFNHEQKQITLSDKVDLLEKHIKLYEKTWKQHKNYNILKRFYKIYLNGFHGASEWRDALMRTNKYDEALEIIATLRKSIFEIQRTSDLVNY